MSTRAVVAQRVNRGEGEKGVAPSTHTRSLSQQQQRRSKTNGSKSDAFAASLSLSSTSKSNDVSITEDSLLKTPVRGLINTHIRSPSDRTEAKSSSPSERRSRKKSQKSSSSLESSLRKTPTQSRLKLKSPTTQTFDELVVDFTKRSTGMTPKEKMSVLSRSAKSLARMDDEALNQYMRATKTAQERYEKASSMFREELPHQNKSWMSYLSTSTTSPYLPEWLRQSSNPRVSSRSQSRATTMGGSSKMDPSVRGTSMQSAQSASVPVSSTTAWRTEKQPVIARKSSGSKRISLGVSRISRQLDYLDLEGNNEYLEPVRRRDKRKNSTLGWTLPTSRSISEQPATTDPLSDVWKDGLSPRSVTPSSSSLHADLSSPTIAEFTARKKPSMIFMQPQSLLTSAPHEEEGCSNTNTSNLDAATLDSPGYETTVDYFLKGVRSSRGQSDSTQSGPLGLSSHHRHSTQRTHTTNSRCSVTKAANSTASQVASPRSTWMRGGYADSSPFHSSAVVKRGTSPLASCGTPRRHTTCARPVSPDAYNIDVSSPRGPFRGRSRTQEGIHILPSKPDTPTWNIPSPSTPNTSRKGSKTAGGVALPQTLIVDNNEEVLYTPVLGSVQIPDLSLATVGTLGDSRFGLDSSFATRSGVPRRSASQASMMRTRWLPGERRHEVLNMLQEEMTHIKDENANHGNPNRKRTSLSGTASELPSVASQSTKDTSMSLPSVLKVKDVETAFPTIANWIRLLRHSSDSAYNWLMLAESMSDAQLLPPAYVEVVIEPSADASKSGVHSTAAAQHAIVRKVTIKDALIEALNADNGQVRAWEGLALILQRGETAVVKKAYTGRPMVVSNIECYIRCLRSQPASYYAWVGIAMAIKAEQAAQLEKAQQEWDLQVAAAVEVATVSSTTTPRRRAESHSRKGVRRTESTLQMSTRTPKRSSNLNSTTNSASGSKVPRGSSTTRRNGSPQFTGTTTTTTTRRRSRSLTTPGRLLRSTRSKGNVKDAESHALVCESSNGVTATPVSESLNTGDAPKTPPTEIELLFDILYGKRPMGVKDCFAHAAQIVPTDGCVWAQLLMCMRTEDDTAEFDAVTDEQEMMDILEQRTMLVSMGVGAVNESDSILHSADGKYEFPKMLLNGCILTFEEVASRALELNYKNKDLWQYVANHLDSPSDSKASVGNRTQVSIALEHIDDVDETFQAILRAPSQHISRKEQGRSASPAPAEVPALNRVNTVPRHTVKVRGKFYNQKKCERQVLRLDISEKIKS